MTVVVADKFVQDPLSDRANPHLGRGMLMARVAVGVGQHHFIRSYLPALIAVLLSSALALVGIGMVIERHIERLATSMAQYGSPGHQIGIELDLAVGRYALDSVLAVETGDDRLLAESADRLDSAARAYDGWIRAAGIHGVTAVTPLMRGYQERVAVATGGPEIAVAATGARIDAAGLESAVGDVSDVLRRNRRAAATDATRMLAGIATCEHQRRWVEMAVMGLLAAGCIALMIAARRREERICHAEKSAVRDLEQTNADLEAFAGRVAHDLRNPLVPILNGSHVIEQTTEEGPARRAAERIERSARRIASMIDMLLDFSRMASARHSVETDVRPVVEDVVDGFRDRAGANGFELHLHCDDDLHALAEPIVVASPLQNLIENALKYGRRPDVQPVIEVRAFWRDGMVVLEVEDRGPGITVAAADTLFRAFSRAQEGGEGVGLGLATARRLVEARGGGIALRDGSFGGALFEVRIPAAHPPRGVPLVSTAAAGWVPA